jgi:hypothetical protein
MMRKPRADWKYELAGFIAGEHRGPPAPITLPRVSIQHESENGEDLNIGAKAPEGIKLGPSPG